MRFAPFVLAAALLAGCASTVTVARPPVTDPVWSNEMVIHVQVCSPPGTVQPGASVRLRINNEWRNGETDASGHLVFMAIPRVPESILEVAKPGYKTWTQRVALSYGVTLSVDMERAWPVPQALHVDGLTMRTPDGVIAKWRGMSAFLMLRQWLDGQDLTPQFELARSLGINAFRVFTRLAWGPIKPSDYSDAQLLAFVRHLAANGFRAEMVALADAGHEYGEDWYMPLAQQQAHLERLARVIGREPNVLLEAANEPSMNGVNPLALTKPAIGIWSRGSSHGRPSLAIEPGWDYGTAHPAQDEIWPEGAIILRQYAEGLKIPYVGNEPVGTSDGTISGTSAVCSDHFDYHAVAALYSTGSTIQSEAWGIRGVLPVGKELECVRAAARAWTVIPDDAQLGSYTAGHLSDCPLAFQTPDDPHQLRIFCSLSGREAICVRQRADDAPPVAIRGWSVARQDGHVVFLKW